MQRSSERAVPDDTVNGPSGLCASRRSQHREAQRLREEPLKDATSIDVKLDPTPVGPQKASREAKYSRTVYTVRVNRSRGARMKTSALLRLASLAVVLLVAMAAKCGGGGY